MRAPENSKRILVISKRIQVGSKQIPAVDRQISPSPSVLPHFEQPDDR